MQEWRRRMTGRESSTNFFPCSSSVLRGKCTSKWQQCRLQTGFLLTHVRLRSSIFLFEIQFAAACFRQCPLIAEDFRDQKMDFLIALYDRMKFWDHLKLLWLLMMMCWTAMDFVGIAGRLQMAGSFVRRLEFLVELYFFKCFICFFVCFF